MEAIYGVAERVAALEVRCDLLSASLKQADAVRDQMAVALKEARNHVPVRNAPVLMQIDAALSAAGAK